MTDRPVSPITELLRRCIRRREEELGEIRAFLARPENRVEPAPDPRAEKAASRDLSGEAAEARPGKSALLLVGTETEWLGFPWERVARICLSDEGEVRGIRAVSLRALRSAGEQGRESGSGSEISGAPGLASAESGSSAEPSADSAAGSRFVAGSASDAAPQSDVGSPSTAGSPPDTGSPSDARSESAGAEPFYLRWETRMGGAWLRCARLGPVVPSAGAAEPEIDAVVVPPRESPSDPVEILAVSEFLARSPGASDRTSPPTGSVTVPDEPVVDSGRGHSMRSVWKWTPDPVPARTLEPAGELEREDEGAAIPEPASGGGPSGKKTPGGSDGPSREAAAAAPVSPGRSPDEPSRMPPREPGGSAPEGASPSFNVVLGRQRRPSRTAEPPTEPGSGSAQPSPVPGPDEPPAETHPSPSPNRALVAVNYLPARVAIRRFLEKAGWTVAEEPDLAEIPRHLEGELPAVAFIELSGRLSVSSLERIGRPDLTEVLLVGVTSRLRPPTLRSWGPLREVPRLLHPFTEADVAQLLARHGIELETEAPR